MAWSEQGKRSVCRVSLHAILYITYLFIVIGVFTYGAPNLNGLNKAYHAFLMTTGYLLLMTHGIIEYRVGLGSALLPDQRRIKHGFLQHSAVLFGMGGFGLIGINQMLWGAAPFAPGTDIHSWFGIFTVSLSVLLAIIGFIKCVRGVVWRGVRCVRALTGWLARACVRVRACRLAILPAKPAFLRLHGYVGFLCWFMAMVTLCLGVTKAFTDANGAVYEPMRATAVTLIVVLMACVLLTRIIVPSTTTSPPYSSIQA
jgi:hypothetical protein